MDYKYIEQLLEHYWQCETTLQEEGILRTFFSQEDVPAELQAYKPLFQLEQMKEEPLGDDFDARILRKTMKARTVRLRKATARLMPLFKAAAIVAIILTIGNAAQAPWDRGWDDPDDAYARYRQQQIDTVNIVAPIQAENQTESIADTTLIVK